MEFQINNGTIERKPKCEHVYGEIYFEESTEDMLYCLGTLCFKCDHCGELLRIKIDRKLINSLMGR